MPAAFFFDPDAYFTEERVLVGRRAAGAAFLRAAVEGRGRDPLTFYAGRKKNLDQLNEAIRSIDSAAKADWIPINRTDMLAKVGTMFRPDPALGGDGRIRLRSGPAAYSLCGITHTVSSARALEAISQLVAEPVMPWDALICTSTAALGVVKAELEATLDHHRWRMKLSEMPPMLQLPVIPLGVHCRDHAPSEDRRQAARKTLGIAEEEIAVLFAGRLSFATKAHPYQMYRGLALSAERTGKKVVLVQAGQANSESAGVAIRDATAAYSGDVRALFVDGTDTALYAAAYSGADIFMSLSDNIQETFGITPVEAMAAGLPVIVSDWNGYRDTIRDGIDGFRITTRAPQAGGPGRRFARAYHLDQQYEMFTLKASSAVSMDFAELVDRLADLIDSPELRRRMGEAGRARAVGDYDWSVIYRRYRELWTELGKRRRHALADREQSAWIARAPWSSPAHQDPFHIFAHYPTRTIGPATIVRTAPGAVPADIVPLAGQPIFQHWQVDPAAASALLGAVIDESRTIASLAGIVKLDVASTIQLAANLAKLNLLLIEDGGGGASS